MKYVYQSLMLRIASANKTAAIVRSALILTLSSLATTVALADARAFAPARVLHILQLQGTSITDAAFSTEPCTTAGLAEAARRASNALDNRDFVTLYIEQHGYANGFAHCALAANTRADFLVLASAFTTATSYALTGARGSHGRYFPIDHARAQQANAIAHWLLYQSDLSQVDRSNLRQAVSTLHLLRLI